MPERRHKYNSSNKTLADGFRKAFPTSHFPTHAFFSYFTFYYINFKLECPDVFARFDGSTLLCDDEDFASSMTIARVLIQHTIRVYQDPSSAELFRLTAERHISEWCKKGVLTRIKQGYYERNDKPTENSPKSPQQ